MRISEVSERTGLDVSSIRFYERKGLIDPKRSGESKYRNYTEEDVERLKTIVLYRKMNFSIESIRSLILETSDLTELLLEQKEALSREREQIDGAIYLCDKILQEHPGAPMDLDHYLNLVRAEEKKGSIFPAIIPVLDEIAENSKMERFFGYPLAVWIRCHPWMRRGISIALFLMMTVFPLVMLVSQFREFAGGEKSVIALFFWLYYFLLCSFTFLKLTGVLRKR